MHAPTQISLESKIKSIEAEVESYGRSHTVNTFFMAFYSGDARVYDDRKLKIKLREAKSSTKLVQYSIEERLKNVNNGRFTYSVLAFDCPRPMTLITSRKNKKAA